jgi:AcrR family transcriptional regulator
LRAGQHSFTIGNPVITKGRRGNGRATGAAPTRERILDAAVELFGRRGYRGTSVGEIERAAGLAPRSGALYKHFPSKKALLEAAVERRGLAADRLEPLVWAADLGDIRSELRAMGRLGLREIGRDQAVLRIVMREGENFPELRERFHDRVVRQGHAQTVALLRRIAERAGARDLDLDALAAVLLGPIINYRVLETLFGRPPGGVPEGRFLEAWVDSALALLEGQGLAAATTTEEARP